MERPLRIFHTADWQIGRQFGNLSGDAAALVRMQRLATVERIARMAQEQSIDAVLVAGDVFEHNAVSDETLRRTLNALAAYRGPWVLLPGNHDAALAESVWSRLHRLGLPDNIHLATRPEPLLLCNERLAVLPAPLMRRHETRDLTAVFDTLDTPAGALRIGLAHGSIRNRLPERSEAFNEIAEDRSESARLDYLALGDWHGTLEIAARTWYAGTPEPDRFHNNRPGNLLCITLTRPGAPIQIDTLPCGHFHWTRLSMDLYGVQDIAALEQRLQQLQDPRQQILRLQLSGTLDLAGREQLEQLLDEWQARLHHLERDDRQLRASASPSDIERLSVQGFVEQTIHRLQAQAESSENARSATARQALQILYHEHRRLTELER